MRPHSLGLLSGEGSSVRVLYDFQFVLLVFVEEAVKGCWMEVKSLCNQRSERLGEYGHLRDVGFVGWAEGGQEGGVGPLIWGEEVVVEGVGGLGKRMSG